MTEPYTDADVQLVASTFITEAKKNPVSSSPPWGPQTRLLLGPTEHDIARAVLDALAAAGRLAPIRADPSESRRIADGKPFRWDPSENCYCGGPEEIYPHRRGTGRHCRAGR